MQEIFPMGSSSSSTFQSSLDLTSGQDAAARKADELTNLRANRMQQMMTDPLSAVASGHRIRQLANYLDAYRTGRQLADQEVVPFARVGSAGVNHTHSHSGGR